MTNDTYIELCLDRELDDELAFRLMVGDGSGMADFAGAGYDFRIMLGLGDGSGKADLAGAG